MIIDNEFSKMVSGLELSEVFVDAISEMYKEFSFQVMFDLTDFNYSAKDYSAFVSFGLMSEEYALQKYFEPRLDTYIRDYLIYKVVETVLEDRGIDVYQPSLADEDYGVDIFYQTQEYERKAGLEFFTYDEERKVGYRYTKIEDYEAAYYLDTGMLDEIVVIDWENVHGISDEIKNKEYWGEHGKQIRVVGSEDVFLELFGEDEGKAFNLFLKYTIEQFKVTLGITSLPKLTRPMLFQHRIEEEKIIKEKSLAQSIGYLVIESENGKNYPDIERASQEFIKQSGILKKYLDKKLYRAMVGKSDFARSFLTSEYLYQQFNNNDMFDYTAVVSGYLKSVEQLMFQIVLQYCDKRDIQGKLYRVGSPKYKTTLTKEHVEANKISATMGNLIFFFKDDYPETVNIVSEGHRKVFYDCLDLFLDECRNQSFHKHNNYDWSRVERIRNNTFVMYIILLGACVLENDEDSTTHFAIVENDKLERIYYWLRRKKMYTFKVKMPNEQGYLIASRTAERQFPEVDEYGLLVDFTIPITCTPEDKKIKDERNLIISREYTPDELWHITYVSQDKIDLE